jgi:hypothetical protein
MVRWRLAGFQAESESVYVLVKQKRHSCCLEISEAADEERRPRFGLEIFVNLSRLVSEQSSLAESLELELDWYQLMIYLDHDCKLGAETSCAFWVHCECESL